MKTTAIIAEFNPFHNGHEYILKEAKELTSSDYIIVIMSGSFVQRGEPAFMYKYDRVRSALCHGADLVLELPVSYATATAETFAYGAVSIATQIGVTDCLAFGAEHDDIDRLVNVAGILSDPTPEIKNRIESGIKEGLSYPASRSKALPEYEDILGEPNNILAIEYIKALIRQKSSITPVAVRRIGSSYNSCSILTENEKETGLPDSSTALSLYPSALSIRNLLSDHDHTDHSDDTYGHIRDNHDLNPDDSTVTGPAPFDLLKKCMSASSYKILADSYRKTMPVTIDDMIPILDHIMIYADSDILSSYQDMNTDIASRFIRTYRELTQKTDNIAAPFTISSMLKSMRTKELTYSRLSRGLIHTILGLKDITRDGSGFLLPCPYTRILGFKQDASKLMRRLSEDSEIPLINKPGDASKNLDKEAYKAFESTILADRLYDSVIRNKFGTILKDTCRSGPLII